MALVHLVIGPEPASLHSENQVIVTAWFLTCMFEPTLKTMPHAVILNFQQSHWLVIYIYITVNQESHFIKIY